MGALRMRKGALGAGQPVQRPVDRVARADAAPVQGVDEAGGLLHPDHVAVHDRLRPFGRGQARQAEPCERLVIEAGDRKATVAKLRQARHLRGRDGSVQIAHQAVRARPVVVVPVVLCAIARLLHGRPSGRDETAPGPATGHDFCRREGEDRRVAARSDRLAAIVGAHRLCAVLHDQKAARPERLEADRKTERVDQDGGARPPPRLAGDTLRIQGEGFRMDVA